MNEKTVAQMTNEEIVEAGLAQGINTAFDMDDAVAFRRFCRAMNCTHLSYTEADKFLIDNYPKSTGEFLALAKKMHELKQLDSMH